ncbi:hypothetical protein GHK03_07850 [Sinorhizobium medicae]|uniref:hypothetical protein n=1 Tax=Sinorhizobium medicae TaxID=110321 RepID=UPI0012953D56|nr:hypothetical protein [Sinorhizobium medicae]MQX96110.1 hypothetical protein [Sinorhizobium medicae]
MSAEGKKKRGESGNANAKHIAFRYGGSKCNVSTALGRSARVDRARFLSAMVMGVVVERLYGYKANATSRMYNWADEAMDVCTWKGSDLRTETA